MPNDHTDNLALSLELPKRAVALVLAGGRGSRLKNLTDRRAKPAVYFGGKFRIIDFALSNCVNSGIRRIGVITQYKSHSLLRHLQRGWSFLRAELNEMVDLLPAQQRVGEEHWYRGTADAIYQNLDIIQSSAPDYIVVLAGDHVYKMDYSLMLKDHVSSGAGCTVGCIEVPRSEASAFGVMAVDTDRNVTEFVEKPVNPPAMPGNDEVSLASMGIYIFIERLIAYWYWTTLIQCLRKLKVLICLKQLKRLLMQQVVRIVIQAAHPLKSLPITFVPVVLLWWMA